MNQNTVINIAFIVIAIVLVASLLTGCGDTITSSVKPDWRSIHQPAPTTPGGGDGHGN
jgi:hypothetical protein